jgi:hypothetical protein
MGTAGKGERLAAAIAALTVSLSILAGMNRLADRYVREALEGPRPEAGIMRPCAPSALAAATDLSAAPTNASGSVGSFARRSGSDCRLGNCFPAVYSVPGKIIACARSLA